MPSNLINLVVKGNCRGRFKNKNKNENENKNKSKKNINSSCCSGIFYKQVKVTKSWWKKVLNVVYQHESKQLKA